MINLNLFDFQQETVDRLLTYTEDLTSKNTIVVKSPTGSGKTIILIDYVDEYLEVTPETAFIWL